MRLWSKQLISVLPREQLTSQWREVSAIAGAIQKNGTPNHLLVNFVLDYPLDEFVSYSKLVRDEMTKRGYRTMDSVWQKISSLGQPRTQFEKIYYNKMDKTYLTICYWNLYEKYSCGGISKGEWEKIEEKYASLQ